MRVENVITEKKKLPYTHYSEELNAKISELMEDFDKFTEKAKSYGLDVRLFDTSKTLVLYYNDDYPDTLLVDKRLSSDVMED